MDKKTHRQFQALRDRFCTASDQWPNLSSVLITWPEDRPEPQSGDFPAELPPQCCVPYPSSAPDGTLWWKALLVGGYSMDTPDCRYRAGLAGLHYLFRSFGKCFSDPRQIDHPDETAACADRFKTLAQVGVRCLERAGPAIRLSANTLSWRGLTRWVLAVHETVEGEERYLTEWHECQILPDIFLASAQAIDAWMQGQAASDSVLVATGPTLDGQQQVGPHILSEYPPSRHLRPAVVHGPFYVAASQVVCDPGLRCVAPQERLFPLILTAIAEADRRIRDFMPIAGRSDSSYRTSGTWANQIGFGRAWTAVRDLADVLQKHWGCVSAPSARTVQHGGATPEQNVAVNSLWEAVDSLVAWFRQQLPEEGRASDPIPELPEQLFARWESCVTVVQRYVDVSLQVADADAARDGATVGANDVAASALPNKPVAQSTEVMLFGRADNPWVKGKEKQPLTPAQYDVVMALIQAGDSGLTKDRLNAKSRHGDARKIMKRLADSDPDWKAVLLLPGKTGRRYRIR